MQIHVQRMVWRSSPAKNTALLLSWLLCSDGTAGASIVGIVNSNTASSNKVLNQGQADRDLSVAHALTWRYIVALMLVGVLSTAAWWLLHRVIAAQESTAATVNVSGRQRMLSQRTALLANLLVFTPVAQREPTRKVLRESIERMAWSHQGLTQGDDEMRLPATMSVKVHAMYYGPHGLDSQVMQHVSNVQQWLSQPDESLRSDHPLLQEITHTATGTLVQALDAMVRQYQTEGEAAVAELARTELVFWWATLLLLSAEALLIFRPFVGHMRRVIARLQAALLELSRQGEHLEKEVRRRTLDLSESEQRFRDVAEVSSDWIWEVDAQWRYTFVSKGVAEVLGYQPSELIGLTPFDKMKPEHAAAMRAVFASFAFDRGPISDLEYVMVDRQGAEQITLSSARPVRAPDGGLLGYRGVDRVVTAQKQAEEKLQFAASVFTHAREGIMLTDSSGQILDVNAAFSAITGYARNEVLGQNVRLLRSGRHGPEFYEVMWRELRSDGQWSGEVWNRRKNGEVYAQLLNISAVPDAQGRHRHFVALFSDITPLKDQAQALERLAHYDALTGLPNRLLLRDRLRQAMAQVPRRGQLLALAFVDLDGFKAVNDAHGHEAGDHLLCVVAARMKQTLREGDTLARLGGDEFVAVICDLSHKHDCKPMLQRLLDVSAQPVAYGALSLQVTASIGVACYPQAQEMDADQLLRLADQAMYQAKISGKNAYRIFGDSDDSGGYQVGPKNR